MLFDVYDLEWPAYSSPPPFFEYCFSVEAAKRLELGVATGWGTRGKKGKRKIGRGGGIASEGSCNERILGAGVGVREEG
jgi:hypothetical protein